MGTRCATDSGGTKAPPYGVEERGDAVRGHQTGSQCSPLRVAERGDTVRGHQTGSQCSPLRGGGTWGRGAGQTSDLPQRWLKGKKVKICHCEPVTDVTGVAIS